MRYHGEVSAWIQGRLWLKYIEKGQKTVKEMGNEPYQQLHLT